MKAGLMMGGLVFGLFWLVLSVLLIINGRVLLSLPLLYLAALFIPLIPWNPPVRVQVITTFVAYLIYLIIWIGGVMTQKEIYRTPRGEKAVMDLYHEKMTEWPVEYAEEWVPTTWGQVHVVMAGKVENPPAVLLHASSMSSWSWKLNVESLTKNYRVLALDLPGEAGPTRLESLSKMVFSDEDIKDLYQQIFDYFGLDGVLLIGASAGGHQAMRIALALPDRVNRLVLAGPMGISSPTKPLIIMTAGMILPIYPVNALMTRWALGSNIRIKNECYPWFLGVLKHVMGRPTPPRRLSDEELQSLRVPVLLVLAINDNLVGDPHVARERAESHIRDVEIHVLASSHLVNVERAEEVNALIDRFSIR